MKRQVDPVLRRFLTLSFFLPAAFSAVVSAAGATQRPMAPARPASRPAAARPPVAGPLVEIVVGPSAPPLERFAAQELAGQFAQLFGLRTRIGTQAPAGATPLVLLGSPATNPAVKTAAGTGWPQLSDQGHLLRSSRLGNRPALIVGGGSPVATLWAVYELGYHFGIRYLLHGDAYPIQKPPLKLTGLDRVMEPALRLRTWRTINDFAIGPEAWGLADQKKLLGQLAKLKFNRILMAVYAWQPFVHFEFNGARKQTALLWYGYRYPVDGDTAGRAVFGGAREFTNPDFSGKASYQERIQTGTRLATGILDTAHSLGMSVALGLSPLEFPKEFASALPGSRQVRGLENLTIGPGPRHTPADPTLKALATAQLRAYLDTYPTVDALYLTMPEFPDWEEQADTAWEQLTAGTGIRRSLRDLEREARGRNQVASGDRGVRAVRGNVTALRFFQQLFSDPAVLRRTDRKPPELVFTDVDTALYPVLDKVLPPGAGALHLVDYTARRVVENAAALARVPARSVRSSLILTLADDNVGVLPQLADTSVAMLVGRLQDQGWEGFSTRYWIVGDLNPSVHYLSRSAWDPKVTVASALDDLVTPISGEGVAEPLAKGFGFIEEATTLIDRNDLGFTFPVPGVVMKHYRDAPVPAWWGEVRDRYLKATDEMYRANTRARGGARTLSLYPAKRLEFATSFLNCLEAVRLAGQAKAKRNREEQVAQLEKAVEAIYAALNSMAEVTRDPSDRGVIAVLNEYGYRPLKAELERVGKE